MEKAFVEKEISASKDGAKTKCSHAMSRSNSFGYVRSRYLREPTDSCHNLCKYGGKHEPERDEKRLTFRRFMANRFALETVEDLLRGQPAIHKTKKKVIKMKPSDTTKALELNIQPNEVGISDNSVKTDILTPLFKHQRAISSPQFILTEDWKQHAGSSLGKEIGSINVASEAHSPPGGSKESLEKEILPRVSEQNIRAQVEEDEKALLQFTEIIETENNNNVDSGVLLLESKSSEISGQETENNINVDSVALLPASKSNEISLQETENNVNNVDSGVLLLGSKSNEICLQETENNVNVDSGVLLLGRSKSNEISPQETENNINVDSGALLLGSKSIEISPQVNLPELPDDEIIHARFLNRSKNKGKVNKPNASSMLKPTHVKSNIVKLKNSSASTEADSRRNTNISEEKVLSNPKEPTTSTALEVIKPKKIVSRKQSASPKLQSNNQNASFPSRKTSGSVTPAIYLNVRTPMMMSIPQLNTSRSINGRMNREEKCLKTNEMPEDWETKLLKPQGTYISSTIPDHSSVSLKARKSRRHVILKKSGKTKDDNGDFNEKILKVVEPKKYGKGLEPHDKLSKVLDGHASNSAVGEASEHSKGQNLRKFKRISSKEEDKRPARRTPAVQQSDGSSSSPYKLKFKRGKVIELRTADSVGPRRLKFRRGRVLGENPIGEVAKRSFRRRRDIGDSNEHKSEAHAVMLKKANLESKVGMFKYEDAQGKKEIRALFNHVIEETASKLVETRKSKVKALVGAFETVISLQEAKSASLL
ncbi:uncharacterized protein LOC110098130 [Dendrobium catenatum]|uniref:Calmodulin-binding domain-containing protein n=1 Tax=Dendrobium catenatum TaxID=906689 RepID=A0A2I0WGY6_9ASPA|nr:uncharacterized protein LOC110098130 [Dendrobium catenatum]XP_028552602.1 uncharacterized protein LOC110098130 [Dendrobium catenatum]PKU74909.1 hypothetical protein MA16_Dca020681 [Dendrobium catenatum]